MIRKCLIPLTGLLLALGATPSANAQDVQVSNLTFDVRAGRSVRLKWTRGNLDGVIVVMRLTADGVVPPADGTDYSPNPVFGDTGSEITPNNYVVYKGTGISVLVTGLTMSTSYSVEAYEFSGDPASPAFLPGPDSATDATTNYAVHNYDFRVECNDCHNHGSFFARGAELKAVCTTCHNPTGLGKDKLEFGYEEVPTTTGHPDPTRNTTGIDVVDCGMCHELHNHTSNGTDTTLSTNSVTLAEQHNKSFLRANVDKHVPGAATPAYLHTDTPGGATPDRAVEGGTEAIDPPTALQARGYCQVCHTETLYHRSSNTAGSDQCHDGNANDSCAGTEVNCGDCHQHTGNFEGAGDCTTCHNSVRGIRPEIVSQFNRATSHVTPAVGSVTEEDCLVCHDHSTHKAQTVRINDPDDVAGSFSQPTAAAPTLDPGQGSAYEPACLNCHDSDGATRLTGNTGAQTPMSPFTDAPSPLEFDAAIWAQSSHGSSSVVTCLGDGTGGGCHGSGHGSANNALLAPAATEILDDHITNLCAGCHDADGPSTFDIAGEFDWATTLQEVANTGALINQRHDVIVADQQYSTGDPQGSLGFDCGDCHSPHEDASQSIVVTDPGPPPVYAVQNNPVVNPDTGAALQVYSIDNTYVGDATSFTYYDGTDAYPDLDPTNPEGGTLIREPDYIEFCLVCHDGTTPTGVTMSPNMLNMADSYRLDDQHGRLEGRNSSSRGYLKPPWTTQANYDSPSPTQPGGGDGTYAALNCTLCHGPHGSGNIFNLRTSITVNGTPMTVGGREAFMDPALCTRRCTGGDGTNPDEELPEFGSTTYFLPVQEDLAWGAWCTFCHEPSHGTSDGTGCQSGHLHGGGNF